MKSVGLVGVNTYHAEAFSRIFNGDADTPSAIEGARIRSGGTNWSPDSGTITLWPHRQT
jgi:hypothetical protein